MEKSNNGVIWDCGSSLYDSFELNEFRKQLRSALAARTLSMPHLSQHRPPPPSVNKKQASPSKISRTIQRLIRAVFKPKTSRITNKDSIDDELNREFSDRASTISTIPELPEFDELSPEMTTAALARFISSDSLGITFS